MSEYRLQPHNDFYQQTIANYSDLQRGYLFRATFINPMVSDDTIVTWFVSETATPQETTGTIPVDWMNSQIKLAGRTTYASWNVTVRSDMESKMLDYFTAWRNIVYDKRAGASGLPASYKSTINLDLLGYDENTINASYTLIGAWPSTIGSTTVSYSTEGIFTFPITFEYDHYESTADNLSGNFYKNQNGKITGTRINI